LNEEHERVLYVQASTLRGIDPRTNCPSVLIGDGLFSSTSSSGVVRVRLEAKRLIQMHTEIITNYGHGFRYPAIEDTEEAKEEEQEEDLVN